MPDDDMPTATAGPAAATVAAEPGSGPGAPLPGPTGRAAAGSPATAPTASAAGLALEGSETLAQAMGERHIERLEIERADQRRRQESR
jgi:hypothetical protein